MQLFSNDLGIDLGSSNILIYADGKGVTIREPSVVAIDKNSGKILQVGSAARNMLGRTPGNIVAMSPLKDGIISDHEITVKMLQELFRSTSKSKWFKPKPRVIISVPSGITEIEERAVIGAAIAAGARRAYLIEAPLAAGLGAGLDLSGPIGHMVVDIGGGTTDIAVLTMNGVAASSSVKLSGSTFDETITAFVRRRYGVLIGASTAEDIKIQLGCLAPRPEDLNLSFKGREIKSGIPREVSLSSTELMEPLQHTAHYIGDEILSVLENTSPELVGDITENGIILTGGGSQIWGADQFLSQHTGIPCILADEPASCTAYGCGKSLAWIDHMTDGPINIARERAMRR